MAENPVQHAAAAPRRNPAAIIGVLVLVVTVAFYFACKEEGILFALLLLSVSLFLEFIILRADFSDPNRLVARQVWFEVLKLAFAAAYCFVTHLAGWVAN